MKQTDYSGIAKLASSVVVIILRRLISSMMPSEHQRAVLAARFAPGHPRELVDRQRHSRTIGSRVAGLRAKGIRTGRGREFNVLRNRQAPGADSSE